MIYHNTELIREHYETNWNNAAAIKKWNKGPIHELPQFFSVLEFRPTIKRDMWTYATCGMSTLQDREKIELHIHSPERNEGLVELLTVVVHFHATDSSLGLWHTVNFGRGWLPDSNCEYGLISLPYLDGPGFEILKNNNDAVSFYWLIPITKDEVDYKIKNGIECLEDALEKANVKYLDKYRASVIGCE